MQFFVGLINLHKVTNLLIFNQVIKVTCDEKSFDFEINLDTKDLVQILSIGY
jgi:hypothetical protein